ncbi:MAG: hypothetical protein J6J36_00030 [Clostridia bacterium]|nr:hypothetical protein [Clostridia bacterium]
MNVIKKIFIIMFIVAVTLATISSKSYATNTSDIINGGDAFIKNAGNREIFNKQNEQEGVDQLYYIMTTIGIVLAFLVGSILGIQFITSGAAGQAKVKEKLIPFVLGAIIIFGAYGIWRLVYNAFNSVL